jgi:hypothetical protein
MDEKIVKVIESLKNVDKDINDSAITMAKTINETELVDLFNHHTNDFFNTLHTITNVLNVNKECNLHGYHSMFSSTIRVNKKLPIDHFSASILEFANDIYNENEEFFIGMNVPNKQINSGGEFNIIKTDALKNIWKKTNSGQKDIIKEKIISITLYAHAYVYKIAMNVK